MAFATEPKTGEVDDRVRIALGPNQDVHHFEDYDVHASIFQQPAQWSVKLPPGKTNEALLAKYPPGPQTRFALYIGPFRQFTGELYKPSATGDANSTSISLSGRDLMARLLDADVPDERSFNNATFEELFKAALKDVGQENKIVEISNTANVRIKSGVNVRVLAEPVTVDEVKQTPSGPGFRNVVTAKLGESWLHFLERHFQKLGLFPWSDANGNFVLSRPNAEQEATIHFIRTTRVGSRRNNVTRFSYENDTSRRFSHVVIFARNHGRKYGHNHTHGDFVDEEMFADPPKGFGFKWKRKVYRDLNVANEKEARFYAKRKIAEANRSAWKLQYVISGHSAPTLKSFGTERAVICPDIVARVDDDALGIHEDMYIESCQYMAPPRTTVVTLMRIKDLVFGAD